MVVARILAAKSLVQLSVLAACDYEGLAGIRSGYTVGFIQTNTRLAESSIVKVNCTCKATRELYSW